MKWWDNLLLAWRTVRANRLRTGITVAIIAFGIMALVGIITAIEAMNNSLRDSFSTMGANAFSIRFKERRFFGGGDRGADVTKSNTRSRKRVKKSSTGKSLPISRQPSSSNFLIFLPTSASASTVRAARWSITKTKKPIQR